MNLRTKIAGVSAGFLAIVGQSAYAAVPTEASTAVTDLVTDAGTFVASLWPLLIAVVVGFVFMKIFKKGVGRAT